VASAAAAATGGASLLSAGRAGLSP